MAIARRGGVGEPGPSGAASHVQPAPARVPAKTSPPEVTSHARSDAGSAIPVMRSSPAAGGEETARKPPAPSRQRSDPPSPPTSAEPSGATATDRQGAEPHSHRTRRAPS